MRRIVMILVVLSLLPAYVFAGNMIIGSVMWDGVMPAKNPPKIVEHSGVCGSKRSSSVVILKEGKIQGTVAWLTPVDKEHGSIKDAGRMTYIISQKNCEFEPYLLVVPAGAHIEVANDDLRDNWLIIEATGVEKQQILQSVGSKPVKFQVLEPDVIRLSSGFYEWMRGWIVAVDRKFWTDNSHEGVFEFRNIPEGEYTLHVWHPILGEKTAQVFAKPSEITNLTVRYEMPKEKPIPVIDATILTKSEEARDQGLSDDYFKK